ncbi:MAG: RlpA-like double-psi beta-barrel domain-containing protein [Thermoanaerobaculia bacterium]
MPNRQFVPLLLAVAALALPTPLQGGSASRAPGKSVRLRINDRGPFSGGFSIDLSRSAAREIGVDRTRDRHVEMLVIYLPK